jgi:uncharacterized protein
MVVGILTISMEIPAANSLKDKRQVVKSMIDGIRNRFNVSAAEVAENDAWRRATFGVTCVSNDQGVTNHVLDKVVDFVESHPEVSVTAIDLEFV